jgi:FkbM family methyltransferase
MTQSGLKVAARELLRWYLNKFPLRDGKAYFYERWHQGLTPEDRYATVKLAGGFRMKLDLADPEQLKVYFYGHYHERYEAELIRRLLDRGEAFWDLGANVGYFSLVAAAALQNRGQIVAFEPGATAYQNLADNISLNPFTNIRLFNLAVAAKEGEARLYLSGDIADSSASLFGAASGGAGQEVVQTVSLDNFLAAQGLKPPDFIKMDVEGAELAALQGARGLISGSSPPLLLMEMEEKNLVAAGASRAAIQELLSGLGYRAAQLRKGRWLPLDDVQEARGRNIFWFNPDIPQHREKAGRVLNLV